VILADYDPSWPAAFVALRDRAVAVLGDWVVAVEHVGSTAVPGMAAKPVIDLDVLVARGHIEDAVRCLASLGYSSGRRGVVTEVEGLYPLVWPAGEPRHHLYVLEHGGWRSHERIILRDYLRANPQQARAYVGAKQQAARQAADDWELYARLKAPYVEQLIACALEGHSAGD
jgi:GrpB-like predicted nucleotidyltransferase (UPF0157 family)